MNWDIPVFTIAIALALIAYIIVLIATERARP